MNQSDKRKSAYKELLNGYLNSITRGDSFDLSSYNYGDSKRNRKCFSASSTY